MVAHIYNTTEAGELLWIWGQPGLQKKFKVELDYTLRLCLQKNEIRFQT